MALADRLAGLKQVGQGKQRLIADLPASVQINAINQVLNGERSFGAEVDGAIKRLSQGRTPDQIRSAFIDEQRKSPSPLMLLGGGQ